MAGYMKEANRLAEKIRNYHKFADDSGYDQAIYYFDKLNRLCLNARDTGDAYFILSILKDMQALMREMENRKKALK